MALVAPLNVRDIPIKSESGETLITTNDISTAVKDTFINRTAIAPDTYPEIYGSMLQYTSGVPVSVEYFRKRGPYINNQSIDTSYSSERSAVHFSFDLIHNFEIRIDGQLDIVIDTESTETMITGKAFTYAGFKPNTGDMFEMKLIDGSIGLFAVNLTEPMSISRSTHYQISFHLDSMITGESDARIRESVTDELYFDKQYYFGDEVTLLTDTSYNQLKELVRIRKAIISRLMNKFYNVGEKTIIRPDSTYDPFLVEYLLNKISVSDNRRDLCQLSTPMIRDFDSSIWATFISQDVGKLIYTGYTLHIYRQYLFDAGISNVDNFRMVSFIDPDRLFDATRLVPSKFIITDGEYRSVSYVFSGRFYYAVLRSFEDASLITDASAYEVEMAEDSRIFDDLSDTFYSVSDNAYHDLAFFDTHAIATGSNNDMHLPELEYMLFDFLFNNNIDIAYLTTRVLPRFPFTAMTPLDQLYMSAMLLNLIDISIKRVR